MIFIVFHQFIYLFIFLRRYTPVEKTWSRALLIIGYWDISTQM